MNRNVRVDTAGLQDFIDEFIRRKFEDSGKDFFGSRRDLSVTVNPPDDFVLGAKDWVVVISREKPV